MLALAMSVHRLVKLFTHQRTSNAVQSSAGERVKAVWLHYCLQPSPCLHRLAHVKVSYLLMNTFTWRIRLNIVSAFSAACYQAHYLLHTVCLLVLQAMLQSRLNSCFNGYYTSLRM